MSTKAIRKMMEHYQQITNIEGVPRKVQLIEVIHEVEAIERAARTYAACAHAISASAAKGEGVVSSADFAHMEDVMDAIAKDAP